jgi:predicted NBD/HSP70 family sugar kinase
MYRPPTRRTDLCDELDTSPANLARQLASLAAAGIVNQSVEAPTRRPHGARGRPPVFVSLIPDAAHALGIEIGTRTLRAVVCDLRGEIVASHSVPWFPVDPNMTIGRSHELVEHVIVDAGIALDGVIGVGVTAAHAFTAHLTATGALAAWSAFEPATELGARLGVPVSVEDSAIAGGVAEHRMGAGLGRADLMYVSLSAGCAIGFILSGRPHRGATGHAGAVAHAAMTAGRQPCYCGRYGCLETVASPEAVAGLLGKLSGRPVTPALLFELLRAGDRRARRLLAEVGGLIGEALAPAVSLFNPGLCIIGGELSLAGEPLVVAIRDGIERGVRPEIAARLSVVQSRRGREAEVVGAAITQLARAPELLARRAEVVPGSEWDAEH